MRFRKKQVVIEAHQWFKNGDYPADGDPETEGAVVRYYRHPQDDGERLCRGCGRRMYDHGWIDTGNVGNIVCPGDWVLRRANGQYYRSKPDAFERAYEPVDNADLPGVSDGDVAGPAEYNSYVDRVFQHLEHELIAGGYDLGDIAADIDANSELYRMYALLAMTTGQATTSEHVHDAWSMWRYVDFPDHRSIVPFGQLTPEVQAYDDAFRDAIRKVATDLPRLRP